MDIRRTVLLGIFGFSSIVLWDNWQLYQGKNALFSPVKAPITAPASATAAPTGSNASVSVANGNSTTATAIPPNTDNKTAAVAEKIRIQTDVLVLDISTQGGSLVRAELPAHKESGKSGGGSAWLETLGNLFSSGAHQERESNKKGDTTGGDVVLFDQSAARQYEAQSGLVDVVDAPNHRTLYRLVSQQRTLAAGQDTLEVVLEAESGGIKDRLVYTLKRGQYAVGVRHEVTNQQTQPVTPSLYVQLLRDGNKPDGESSFYSTFTGPAVYTDTTKFHKVEFSQIEKEKLDRHVKTAAAQEPAWIGMLQHYFVSAWILPEQSAREIYSDKVNTLYRVGMKQSLGTLAPGATGKAEATLFVGPQDQNMLAKLAPGLDLVVDYAWLTFIAKPIFILLQWLYQLVGNWGWAIVLLTVLIKAAFYPLSAAGYKSMARMKNVAPRMTAMKERYKDDRMKMQQAMMELYKTEKINPMGGCFPILIQIPVFIALYWVLLASVEMRNAPWIGWIHDLAAPDPFFILPLIMMGSMFVQYKLNPTPPDPVQAKMMLWMPLVFGVMFFFFPSGLVLYWVVNNTLSIAQQWRINTQLVKAGLK